MPLSQLHVMVRNLYRRNGRPPFPTRTCWKMTGPGDHSHMAPAMRTHTGARLSRSTSARITSTPRLTNSCVLRESGTANLHKLTNASAPPTAPNARDRERILLDTVLLLLQLVEQRLHHAAATLPPSTVVVGRTYPILEPAPGPCPRPGSTACPPKRATALARPPAEGTPRC